MELSKTIAKTLNIPNSGVFFRDYDKGYITKDINRINNKIYNYYGELRGNKSKCSMLVEHGFYDNLEESRKLLKYEDALVKNISELIAKFFKLKSK